MGSKDLYSPLHPHLVNSHDRAHFFIPVNLSFPKQESISTYAFVDWHSLPWRARSVSIPIFMIND